MVGFQKVKGYLLSPWANKRGLKNQKKAFLGNVFASTVY